VSFPRTQRRATTSGVEPRFRNLSITLFLENVAVSSTADNSVLLTDKEVAEQDFLSLMTVVIETVANISVKEKRTENKTRRRTQMPSLASTLRKKLYFPITRATLERTGPTVAQADCDKNVVDNESETNTDNTKEQSSRNQNQQPDQSGPISEPLPVIIKNLGQTKNETSNRSEKTQKKEVFDKSISMESETGARPLKD